MRKYEILYILNAELDEETRKKEIEGLANVLTSNGAKVLETNEWGVRELAYEINFQKRGYYVIVTLEANDNKATEEFKRLAGINKNVLRCLITRI